MQRGQGGEADRRGAGAIDRIQQGTGPIGIGRAGHHFDRGADGFGAFLPNKGERGEFALDHQYPAALWDHEVAGGGGDAVADRAGDGDVVRRGAEQACSRAAGAFGDLAAVAVGHVPGEALGGHAKLAGLAHGARQRDIGGGVEIGDLARDLEQVALAGQGSGVSHGAFLPRVSGFTT